MRPLVLGSLHILHLRRPAPITHPLQPHDARTNPTPTTTSNLPSPSSINRPHNSPTHGPLRIRLALQRLSPPSNGRLPPPKPKHPFLPRPTNVRFWKISLYSMGFLSINLYLST